MIKSAKHKIFKPIEHFMLSGKRITLFCVNYIFTGKVLAVDADYVLLGDACIVYETGEFSTPQWKDAQKLPHAEWYVALQSVEAFGELK